MRMPEQAKSTFKREAKLGAFCLLDVGWHLPLGLVEQFARPIDLAGDGEDLGVLEVGQRIVKEVGLAERFALTPDRLQCGNIARLERLVGALIEKFGVVQPFVRIRRMLADHEVVLRDGVRLAAEVGGCFKFARIAEGRRQAIQRDQGLIPIAPPSSNVQFPVGYRARPGHSGLS